MTTVAVVVAAVAELRPPCLRWCCSQFCTWSVTSPISLQRLSTLPIVLSESRALGNLGVHVLGVRFSRELL